MNEVVEDIFEIISTDEEVLAKANRESSIITSEPSCATWSLSSSAIVSSNPSISTTYDGDDDLDDVQKQIHSYTSQLFSPLYEVRADQKNVFQENRQPLPKPGRTPKFRNLCYSLGTQLSFDFVDDLMDKREYMGSEQQPSPKGISPQNRRTCSTQEESLLSIVNPLVPMSSTEVKARNFATTTTTHVSSFDFPILDGQRDWRELTNNPSVPPKQNIEEPFLTQINRSPLSYDEVYARKDWMLHTVSTADSGELSLEPLLNAYSEDLDAGEELIGGKKKSEHQSASLDTAENNRGPLLSPPISEDMVVSFDPESQNEKIKETDIIQKEIEKSTTNEVRIRLRLPHPFQIPESLVTTNFSALRYLMLDFPFSPLQYSLYRHTSGRPFNAANSKDDMSCSSLVQYQRPTEEKLSQINSSCHESSWILDEYSHSRNSRGCFVLDIESLCTQFSDWENPMRSKCTFTCGGFERQGNDESNISIDSHGPSNCKDGNHSAEYPSRKELRISSHRHDTETFENIDDIIRDHGLDTVIEFSEGSNDQSELFPSMSQSSCPTSFDSEQFLQDMAKRIESELSNFDVNDFNDGTALSTFFPELPMNLLSSYSYSSDDGLDREIGALELFEMNLKKEIDKAEKGSFLLPLTSPVQTLLSSKSSNCSIDTTFLSEYGASISHSSENMQLRSKTVRKVHFNEQVEEFLYAANEACWTPDAKASGQAHKTESFVEEMYNVLDDILDEINSACISLSAAMDKTKQLSKYGDIRRSSVN
jgi:hypothetical protein